MKQNIINLYSVSAVLAICLIIFLLSKDYNIGLEIKNLQFQLEDEKRKNSQLESIVLLHGRCIELNLVKTDYVLDRNGNELAIQHIIKQPTTIYRINETNCFTCIEKFLPELKKIAKKSNVIILGTYREPRNLFLALKDVVPENIKVYNITRETLANEKIEKLDMPYIFDIDTNLITTNFFIPQKEIQQLSEFYRSNHFN